MDHKNENLLKFIYKYLVSRFTDIQHQNQTFRISVEDIAQRYFDKRRQLWSENTVCMSPLPADELALQRIGRQEA